MQNRFMKESIEKLELYHHMVTQGLEDIRHDLRVGNDVERAKRDLEKFENDLEEINQAIAYQLKP